MTHRELPARQHRRSAWRNVADLLCHHYPGPHGCASWRSRTAMLRLASSHLTTSARRRRLLDSDGRVTPSSGRLTTRKNGEMVAEY